MLINIRDEDFCENTSIIIGNIVKYLKHIHYLIKLFQDLKGLSVVYEVLKRYFMNQTICGNLVYVIKVFFSNARRKNSFESMAQMLKDINIGLVVELINNAIREHAQKAKVVFSCVATFRELSDYKGKNSKQQQQLLKYTHKHLLNP